MNHPQHDHLEDTKASELYIVPDPNAFSSECVSEVISLEDETEILQKETSHIATSLTANKVNALNIPYVSRIRFTATHDCVSLAKNMEDTSRKANIEGSAFQINEDVNGVSALENGTFSKIQQKIHENNSGSYETKFGNSQRHQEGKLHFATSNENSHEGSPFNHEKLQREATFTNFTCNEQPSAKENGMLNDHRENASDSYVDNKQLTRSCYLMRHDVSHNEEKHFVCDICEAKFNLEVSLKTHKKIHCEHTKINTFVCSTCEKTFSMKLELKYHQRIHTRNNSDIICHKKRRYLSRIYKKMFSSKLDSRWNQEIKTMKYFERAFRKMRFFSELPSFQHKRISSGRKPFVCHICKKCFAHSSSLKNHKKIHFREKSYVCDTCKKQFLDICNFEAHKVIHAEETAFVCNICQKAFSCNSSLKMHSRIHTVERPFVRDICNKTFRQSNHLKMHQIIHSGENPFACDICKKAFRKTSHLEMHQIIHSENPFVCDICKKAFTKRSHLKMHQRIHSGENPFVCSFCRNRYSDYRILKVHKRVHSIPFVYDIFEKLFMKDSHLTPHMKIHDEETSFASET